MYEFVIDEWITGLKEISMEIAEKPCPHCKCQMYKHKNNGQCTKCKKKCFKEKVNK